MIVSAFEMNMILLFFKHLSQIRIFIFCVGFYFITSAFAANTCDAITTSTSLLPTHKVARIVDSALIKAVMEFENAGARGGWFKAQAPLAPNQQKQYYYLIQKLPQQANPRSLIFLMKLESSRKFLSDLIQNGRTIVIGKISETDQAAAVTLPDGYEISDRASAANQMNNGKSIILVGLTTDLFTLAHEDQHWKDFENPDFMKALDADFKKWEKFNLLSPEDLQHIHDSIIEIRGYAAQELAFRRAQQAGLSFVDRAGVIQRGQAAEYEFRAADVINRYKREYGNRLRYIFQKLKSQSPSRFQSSVKWLMKYNLSDSSAALTFEKILDTNP